MNDVTIKEIREYISPIVKRNESLYQVLLKYRDSECLTSYGNCISKMPHQHKYLLSYLCGFTFPSNNERQYGYAFIEWLGADKKNTCGYENVTEMSIVCMSDVITAMQNASIVGSQPTIQEIQSCADCYHISTSLTEKCRITSFLKLFSADMDMVITHLKEMKHIMPFYKLAGADQIDSSVYRSDIEFVRGIVIRTAAEFPKMKSLIKVMLECIQFALEDFPKCNSYGKMIFDIGVGWDIDKFADPFPFINNAYRALDFCEQLQNVMIHQLSAAVTNGIVTNNFLLVEHCIWDVLPGKYGGVVINAGNVISIYECLMQILNDDMSSFINKLRINLGLPDCDNNLDESSGDAKKEDMNIRIHQKYFPNWFDHNLDSTDKVKADKETASKICRAILELGWCGDGNH